MRKESVENKQVVAVLKPLELLSEARKRARKDILIGLAWIVGSMVATIGSTMFAGNNDTYLVFYGGIIFGLYLISRGVYLVIDPNFIVRRNLGEVEYEKLFGKRLKKRPILGSLAVIAILLVTGLFYMGFTSAESYGVELDKIEASIDGIAKKADKCENDKNDIAVSLGNARAQLTAAQARSDAEMVVNEASRADSLAKAETSKLLECSALKKQYNAEIDRYNNF